MTSKIYLVLQSEKFQSFLLSYPILAKFIHSLTESYEELWTPKLKPDSSSFVRQNSSSAYLIWALRLQDAMQFLQLFFTKIEKEEVINELVIQSVFKLTLGEDQRHSRDNILGDLYACPNFEFHSHEEAIVNHAYFPYFNLSARSNLILLFSNECLKTPLNSIQCFHQLIANDITYLLKYHDRFSEEKPHRFDTIDLFANPDALNSLTPRDFHRELLYIPGKKMWLSISSFLPQGLPFDEAIEKIRERVVYLYRMQKPIYDAMRKQHPLSDIVKNILPTTYYGEIERLFKKFEKHLTTYEANLTIASLSMKNFSQIRKLAKIIELDTSNQIRLHSFDLHEPYTLKKLLEEILKDKLTNNTLLWALRTFLTRYKDHPCSAIPLPPEAALTHLSQHKLTIENGISSLSTTSPRLPLDDEYMEFIIQCILPKIDVDSIHSLIMSFDPFQNRDAFIAKLTERLLAQNSIEADSYSLATVIAYSGRKLGMILFEKIISHFRANSKLILELSNQLQTTLPESNYFLSDFLSQSRLLDEKLTFLRLLIEHYQTLIAPVLLSIARKTENFQQENKISSSDVLSICRICQLHSEPPLSEREYNEAMLSLSTLAFGRLKALYDERRIEFKLFIHWLSEGLIKAHSESRFNFHLLEAYLKTIKNLEQHLHYRGELLNYFDLNEATRRISDSQNRSYSSYPAERFLQSQGMSFNGLPISSRGLMLPEVLLDKFYFKTLDQIIRQILATHPYRQLENIEGIKDRILPHFKQHSFFWTNLFNEFSSESSATFLRLLNQRIIIDIPLSNQHDLFSYFLGTTRYLLEIENELEREDAFAEFCNSLHPNYFGTFAASTSHLFLGEEKKILFIQALFSFKLLSTMQQFAAAFIERNATLLRPNEGATFTLIFQYLNCRQHIPSYSFLYEIDIYFYFLKQVETSNDLYETLIYSLYQLQFASRNTLSLLLDLLPTNLYNLFFEMANMETLVRDPLASINLCQLNPHQIQCAWALLRIPTLEMLKSNRIINWNDYFHCCLHNEENFNKFLSLLAPDILTSFESIYDFLNFMHSIDHQFWHEKILINLPRDYLNSRIHSFEDLLLLAKYSNNLTSSRAKKIVDDLLNNITTYLSHETISNDLYRRIFEIQTHPIIKHLRVAIEPFLFSLLAQSPSYFRTHFSLNFLILCIMINFPKLNDYLEKLNELKLLDHFNITPHFHYFEQRDSKSLFIELFFKIRNVNIFKRLFDPTVSLLLNISDLAFLIRHHAMNTSCNRCKLFQIYDIQYLCGFLTDRNTLEILFLYGQLENQGSALPFILNAYLKILCDKPLLPNSIPPALLNQLLYSRNLEIKSVIQTMEQFFNLCHSLELHDLRLFWSLRHIGILCTLGKLDPASFSSFASETVKCLRPEHLRALWQNKPVYYFIDKLYPTHELLLDVLSHTENRILLCRALSSYLQDRFKTQHECRNFLLQLKRFIENSSEFTEMAMTIFPQFKMDDLRRILTQQTQVSSTTHLARSHSCFFLLPQAGTPSAAQPPAGYHLRRSASQP